jgi:hypothetical protein
MAVLEISRIQVRRGQENQTGVPTLAGGEFGWAADTEHLYIGLRREDGGARDANVRILTENDLFTAITSLDLGYTYRKDTNPAITAPTFDGLAFERPVSKKLDDFVSVKDFGVLGVGGNEVASALIQVAVDNLFLDPLKTTNEYGTSSAKILYFPAGIYNIDTPIFVPRYTTIIGEGIGKTIINLISDDSHAFQTIDSDPDNAYPDRATFDHNGIGTGITQPNNIHIEGLTIKYDSTTDITNCLELISLDCAENSIIKNVRFAGNYTVGDASTSTYGAILIRGYSGELASSNNVLIDNCEFDGLRYSIGSNHDIVNLTIQNNVFSNSGGGIVFNYPNKNASADIGPRYAKIINNNFKSITGPAIYVGENLSPSTGTNHISMNNRFYDCGNLGNGRASSTGNPVITFVSDTNISKNDWFDRQEYNQANINSNQKYLPLIQGRAFIEQSGVKSLTLTTGILTRILRFPLLAEPQQLIIYYNIFSSSLSDGLYRTGKLVCSLPRSSSPDIRNILDEFTHLEGTLDSSIQWSMYASSGSTYYEVRIIQETTYDVTLSYHYTLSLY